MSKFWHVFDRATGFAGGVVVGALLGVNIMAYTLAETIEAALR